MDLLLEGPDDAGTLTLKGELTIQHSPRLREVLLRVLSETTSLSISLEGIREIDLSGLQVLCSAHRTAVDLRKSISVTGTWSEEIRNVVERAGYGTGRSCGSMENGCFWKSGEC
ncbi:MAG: STAS domain-containing protein [Desulfobacteraceae bacterium]|nr:MAG: STAS domain-containing protein [Desulfobacteraceae bacterium]